jgi:hypothetical protein
MLVDVHPNDVDAMMVSGRGGRSHCRIAGGSEDHTGSAPDQVKT